MSAIKELFEQHEERTDNKNYVPMRTWSPPPLTLEQRAALDKFIELHSLQF